MSRERERFSGCFSCRSEVFNTQMFQILDIGGKEKKEKKNTHKVQFNNNLFLNVSFTCLFLKQSGQKTSRGNVLKLMVFGFYSCSHLVVVRGGGSGHHYSITVLLTILLKFLSMSTSLVSSQGGE